MSGVRTIPRANFISCVASPLKVVQEAETRRTKHARVVRAVAGARERSKVQKCAPLFFVKRSVGALFPTLLLSFQLSQSDTLGTLWRAGLTHVLIAVVKWSEDSERRGVGFSAPKNLARRPLVACKNARESIPFHPANPPTSAECA